MEYICPDFKLSVLGKFFNLYIAKKTFQFTTHKMRRKETTQPHCHALYLSNAYNAFIHYVLYLFTHYNVLMQPHCHAFIFTTRQTYSFIILCCISPWNIKYCATTLPRTHSVFVAFVHAI